MKKLYVAAQHPETRKWTPVAVLEQDAEGFTLRYTLGAKRMSGFSGLGSMHELDAIYHSKVLFPFFANRLVQRNRPEYQRYLEWMGLSMATEDPMTMLAVTGGMRATDSYEIIGTPVEVSEGLEIDFFARGLRYLPDSAVERIGRLERDIKLYLMRDFQNDKDKAAIALRTEKPIGMVGYLPRYYCRAVEALHIDAGCEVSVTVKQVNSDAPLNLKLLCRMSLPGVAQIDLAEHDSDYQVWVDGSPVSSGWLALRQTLG